MKHSKLLTSTIALCCTLALSQASYAAFDPSKTFQEAVQAYKNEDFEKAGDLWTQVGDHVLKTNKDQALKLYNNAINVYQRSELYEKIITTTKKILNSGIRFSLEQEIKFHKNIFFCLGQLKQYAREVIEIEAFLKKYKKRLTNEDKAVLLSTQGDAFRLNEFYTQAIDSYFASLKVMPKKADPERYAGLLVALGLCESKLGDIKNAQKHLEEAIKLSDTLGEVVRQIESRSNLGVLQWSRAHYAQALTLFQDTIARATKANLQRHIGIDSNNIALVYRALGNYKEAKTYLEQSLSIARDVKNKQDEGIAIVNLAMLKRIAGDYNQAEAHYLHAASIFEQINFREGLAGAYLGLGTILELKNFDVQGAFSYFVKALDIYTELKLPRGQIEANLCLGDLYMERLSREQLKLYEENKEKLEQDIANAAVKHDFKYVKDNIELAKIQMWNGKNTGFTLCDEDAENLAYNAKLMQVTPKLPLNDTLREYLESSRNYARLALNLAIPLESTDHMWMAHSILGYCDYSENKLKDAYDHYRTAVELTRAIFLEAQNVANFGEFIATKGKLYASAEAVCHALYESTKEEKYLSEMLQLADTFQNEQKKAAAALSNVKYEDEKMRSLFDKFKTLSIEREKLRQNLTMQETAVATTEDEKLVQKLADEENKRTKERIEQLNTRYEQLLKQWKKEYPNEIDVIDSASRIDIPLIQKSIDDDQIVLSYTQLSNVLVITAIGKKTCNSYMVDILKEDLDNLIVNDFSIKYIDEIGHNGDKLEDEEKLDLFKTSLDILQKLYSYLIKPVEQDLQGISRIYISAPGYISQVPFCALVKSSTSNKKANGGVVAEYLIKKYDIAYLRPSFINQALGKQHIKPASKTLLAIANPKNNAYRMAQLPGAALEVLNATQALNTEKKDVAIGLKGFISNLESKIKNLQTRIKTLQQRINNLEKPKDNLEKSEEEERKKQAQVKREQLQNLQEQLQMLQNLQEQLPMLQNLKLNNIPTERWLRDSLNKNSYEIVYFATHGMPFSNVVSTEFGLAKKNIKKIKKNGIEDFSNSPDAYQKYLNGVTSDYQKNPENYTDYKDKDGALAFSDKNKLNLNLLNSLMVAIREHNLPTSSPLNSFLLLNGEISISKQNSKLFKQDPLREKINTEEDGLLTSAEVMGMKPEVFESTKLVLLSACNTATEVVSDFQKQLNKLTNTQSNTEKTDEQKAQALAAQQRLQQQIKMSEELQQKLKNQGLIPGIDQISLVDSFMRKGAEHVFGNFWFVNDEMSQELLTRFFNNYTSTEHVDIIHDFSQAQRSIIEDCEKGDEPKYKDIPYPIHPFYWAAGAIFGK